MASNIVAEWLRSLHLGQYAESFIDNGYDDLEICKQVGDPDLDAIGVFNPVHRSRLLQSVRTLREEGAASVYFTLEETTAIHEECLCDNASAKSSRTSSGRSDKEVSVTTTNRILSSPGASSSAESAKYLDEYEEGKAELLKIPRIQLKMLLREKLSQDGIKLNCQPYSTSDSERGYLEGLASRYADLFNTHYGDVLGHLEDLRREWTESSPKERTAITPETPPPSCTHESVPVTTSHGLTSSHSQPIYVPGKYSPSSCLSDKEEDEIYGFGYGAFAVQIARQQQQRLMASAPTSYQPLLIQHQHGYQTCLSPRSAYFYEYPPNEQNCTSTGKKRTTFARFLRGLKTTHRKEKHGASSPRHGRASTRDVPQRVHTPNTLQSGLDLTDFSQHGIIKSVVDPRDYERLRHLQMNGGTPTTFEETIYKLKLQEALRKREKFSKEHEDILRDIKQGLQQLGGDGVRTTLSNDDTYMYDEDACMLAPGAHSHDRGHWYDEPPYESDPEDFLMSNNSGPTATIQNGRVCFTLNLRQEPPVEGVISLRTAGDISLPRDSLTTIPKETRRRLISPQTGYAPTIIPLRSLRNRESGEHVRPDMQSIASRLSNLSIDTSRSEQQELSEIISPQYYSHLENKIRCLKKTTGYSTSEDGLSPSQSSDYEDQEDVNNCNQQITAVQVRNSGRSTGVCGIVDKVRGLRQDVQKKLSRLKNDTVEKQKSVEQTYPCSASSAESLPSGSGSSTQALVRTGSNHSSMSPEEIDPSLTDQIIGRARALVDNIPNAYDQEALHFKAGDIIDVISINSSGLWKGICHGKKGYFKFINVELLPATKTKQGKNWHANVKEKPTSVEDLLQKINLPEYISVFVLNGYEDLGLFKEIEPSDLDYLGIVNTDHRAKILTAVQLLQDLEASSEGDVTDCSSECDDHQRGLTKTSCSSPFKKQQFSMDFYEGASKVLHQQNKNVSSQSSETTVGTRFNDNKNNLDSIVEKCNIEILAKVRQARKKGELCYERNIPANSVPTSPSDEVATNLGDSHGDAHRQTTSTDSSRKTVMKPPSNRKCFEEICETDPKLSLVKYVVSESSVGELSLNEAGTINSLGRCCLSEKSSDSGVSSSSLTSGNAKDIRPVLSHFVVFIRQGNNLSDSIDSPKSIDKD